MLAAQIVEFNRPVAINAVPIPPSDNLKPHDLYLKVAAAGLCHTDLEYLRGSIPDTKLPITLSHEAAGTLIAKGSEVTYFSIGNRILAGQTFNRCGKCADCLGPEEYQHYCAYREPLMTVGRDGAFQEYLVVEAAKLF